MDLHAHALCWQACGKGFVVSFRSDSLVFLGGAQDAQGRTALHICAQAAHSHRLFALLGFVEPATLSIKDKDGNTCLGLSEMQFEEAKKSGSATLGLKWQEVKVDGEKKDRGSEIVNNALATALKETHRFSAADLAKYGVCDAYYGRRIRVGDRYFMPVASKKYKQYQEVIKQLRKRDPDREQMTTEG